MVKKQSRAHILQRENDRVQLAKARDDFKKEMTRFGQLLDRRDQFLQNKGEGLEKSRLNFVEMDKKWKSETQHVKELHEALKIREDELVGCVDKWHGELLENEKATRSVAKLRNESTEFNKWFESLVQPQSAEQILWLMDKESEYEHVEDSGRLLNGGHDRHNFTITEQDLFEYDADIYVV